MKISPSQIKTWRECPRKWAYYKIEGIVSPTTPNQQHGTDSHEHLERWVKDGTPFPKTSSGRCASHVASLTAPPKSKDAVVEAEINLDGIVDDVTIYGFADAAMPRNNRTGDDPVVIDYKFTSALRWAMDEEQLKSDPQQIIYSEWARQHFNVPDDENVECRWVYCEFSNANYLPKDRRVVSIKTSATSNDEEWVGIKQTLTEIRDARTGNDLSVIQGNPEACGNYGGCPHKKYCEYSPECGNNVSGGNEVDSLQEKIDNLKKKKEAVEVVVEAVKKPAPTEKATTYLEKLKELNDAKGLQEARTPDLPKTPAVSEMEPGNAGSGKWQRCEALGCRKKVVEGADFCTDCLDDNFIAADAVSNAKEKAKATKPKKTKKSTNPTEPPAPIIAAAPSVALTVVFGAAFVKGGPIDAIHLIDFMRPYMDRVASDQRVPHWAMTDYFVGGRAALSQMVGDALKDFEGTLLCDPDTAECKAVYDVLVENAVIVIRGIR